MNPNEIMFMYVLPALIIVFAIVLSLKSDLIKEGSIEKHYSLSRVQLLWWTVIILCCFSIKFGASLIIPGLDQSVLYLLGIGTGTITVAKLMSDSKKNKEEAKEEVIEHTTKSNGLFYDILDDGDGISVHRFQAVLFNIVFGFTFLNQFFSDVNYSMPAFNNEQLTLLGISSSTYLFMKNSESKRKGSVQAAVTVQANEVNTASVDVSENPRTIIDIDDQEEVEIEAKG